MSQRAVILHWYLPQVFLLLHESASLLRFVSIVAGVINRVLNMLFSGGLFFGIIYCVESGYRMEPLKIAPIVSVLCESKFAVLGWTVPLMVHAYALVVVFVFKTLILVKKKRLLINGVDYVRGLAFVCMCACVRVCVCLWSTDTGWFASGQQPLTQCWMGPGVTWLLVSRLEEET